MELKLKLFNKIDYDYYNPKPYLQKLISFCDTEMENSVAYDIDSNEFDYLFIYPDKKDEEDRRKKRRVFQPNFLDLIKLEHYEKVKTALERAIENHVYELDNKLKSYKDRIRRAENDIKTQLETIEREKKQLKELEDVIAKYSKAGTPELPF